MPDNRGRFKKGEHWRKPKPYWDRHWLEREYQQKLRSASAIAAQFGVTENNILFWLAKLDIPRRSMRQTRKIKHWGSEGPANPMHGKTGILNPNWKGGLSPVRNIIYASSEWKRVAKAVRQRDNTCRLCRRATDLHIHHIDMFSQAPLLVLDIGNMILLCGTCHRKMRGKENAWKRRLFRLIGEGS